MAIEAVKRGLFGISFSAIITFIALTVLKVLNIDASVSDIWSHMLGSLVIGAYFGIGSLIFEIEKWSPLKQTVFHFCLSLAVFFPIALGLGWIPQELPAIIVGVIIFVINYTLFWMFFRWYSKKMEASLNASIRK